MMTKFRFCCAALIAMAATQSLAAPPAPAKTGIVAPPGTLAVATLKLEWNDAARHRAVPATLHFPATGAGPFPLLIISHGLGGTRDGLDYVGNFWASHGYVCAQIQHLGSDDGVWKGAAGPLQLFKLMRMAMADPQNANNRPLDVKFAIDQMLRLNADPKSPLFGRIDASKIGAAGHSFGAFTAQAVAGRNADQIDTWRDPRVKACIAMCPPSKDFASTKHQFSLFKTPSFVLTGTRDEGRLGDTKATDRRVPFDAISGADAYLMTIDGADHMTFGGRREAGQVPNDARDHELIFASTLAFWDAYLKDSATAKAFLRDGGWAKQLGAAGVFEVK